VIEKGEGGRIGHGQRTNNNTERDNLPDKNQLVKEKELLAFGGRGEAAAAASSSWWPKKLVHVKRSEKFKNRCINST
jgi:hypothetical protein